MIIAALVQGGDYCLGQGAIGDSMVLVPIDVPRPLRISSSPSGALFILDRGRNEVRKYSPAGKLLAQAGGYGWGADEAFDAPSDLNAVNDLQILVADYGNHRIAEFDGRLTRTSVVDGDLHQTGQRLFGYPRSAAFDRFGALYVVDDENKRVLKLDRSRSTEQTFGGIEAGKGRLRAPTRIRITDNDRVYVQDGARLMVYDIFGNYLQSLASVDSALTAFTTDRSEVYILAGKALRRVSEGGDTTLVLPISANPADLAVFGKSIILLFPGSFGIVPVDIFQRPPKEEN